MRQGDRSLARWGVLALIGAMLADLAETFVDPANTDNETKLFNAAANHADRMTISAACLFLSALFLVPGVWWVARGIAERGRGFGKLASVLALLGAFGHIALMTTYLILVQMPKGGADSGVMIDLVHRIDHSAAYIAFTGPPAIAFPFPILFLFIAAYRADLLPRWTLATIILAPVSAIALQGVGTVAATGTALGFFLITAASLYAGVTSGASSSASSRT